MAMNDSTPGRQEERDPNNRLPVVQAHLDHGRRTVTSGLSIGMVSGAIPSLPSSQ